MNHKLQHTYIHKQSWVRSGLSCRPHYDLSWVMRMRAVLKTKADILSSATCAYTGCPKKNATSYISLDFRENRKPVFIIYTLLESYISQLSTMKKSQWNDIPVGRYSPKHDIPSDVKSRATGTGLLIHKLALIYLLSPV